MSASGIETVLHSFNGSDGQWPVAGVINDSAGNFYGTTLTGGYSGLGVVFKLAPAGTLKVLHSFTGSDGQYPEAGLVRDAAGNLYGTTLEGGAHNYGTAFKNSAAGTQALLYSFTGASDGGYAAANLTMDKAGNLYGTTEYGGVFSSACAQGCGVVFELALQ